MYSKYCQSTSQRRTWHVAGAGLTSEDNPPYTAVSCTAKNKLALKQQAGPSATRQVFHANVSPRYCSGPPRPLASGRRKLQKRNLCSETRQMTFPVSGR